MMQWFTLWQEPQKNNEANMFLLVWGLMVQEMIKSIRKVCMLECMYL